MGKIFCNLQYHSTFQELIKIAQSYFNVMALYANMEQFFLDAAINRKERETLLAEPVSSLKLVFN